jgi:hypothetical protein
MRRKFDEATENLILKQSCNKRNYKELAMYTGKISDGGSRRVMPKTHRDSFEKCEVKNCAR